MMFKYKQKHRGNTTDRSLKRSIKSVFACTYLRLTYMQMCMCIKHMSLYMLMHVYMCTYIHIFSYILIYTYICLLTYVHTYLHTCKHTYWYVYTYVHTFMHTLIQILVTSCLECLLQNNATNVWDSQNVFCFLLQAASSLFILDTMYWSASTNVTQVRQTRSLICDTTGILWSAMTSLWNSLATPETSFLIDRLTSDTWTTLRRSLAWKSSTTPMYVTSAEQTYQEQMATDSSWVISSEMCFSASKRYVPNLSFLKWTMSRMLQCHRLTG